MSRSRPARLGNKSVWPIHSACRAKHIAGSRNRRRLAWIHGAGGHGWLSPILGLRDSETHCHMRASQPQEGQVSSRPGFSDSMGRSRSWKQDGQRRWWSMALFLISKQSALFYFCYRQISASGIPIAFFKLRTNEFTSHLQCHESFASNTCKWR